LYQVVVGVKDAGSDPRVLAATLDAAHAKDFEDSIMNTLQKPSLLAQLVDG
jgi:hypothetical protein